MGSYKHPRAFYPLDLEIMTASIRPLGRPSKRATRVGIPIRMASARSHYASWCSTTLARAGLISTPSATGC
jgi:hypothetical protein